MSEFHSLPASIAAALDDYDAKCAHGQLTFPHGALFASPNSAREVSSKALADSEMSSWLARHVPGTVGPDSAASVTSDGPSYRDTFNTYGSLNAAG